MNDADARIAELEHELRVTRHRLSMLVDHAEDAIFIKDLAGRYTFINTAGARYLDRRVEEVLGKGDDEIFSPTTAAEIWAIDQMVIQSRRPFTHQPTRLDFGTPRTFFTTKYPYFDEESVLAGVMGVSHDVTDWVRTQQEAVASGERNRELEARLLQADRLATLGTLAAGVAHEINNPLAYLLHHLDRLEGSTEAQEKHLVRAREGARRIAGVVGDLQPSRAGAGIEEVSSCDVEQVLSDVIRLLGHQIRHRARALIEVETSGLHVAMPASRLHQVLVNIVNNASQAIPAGAMAENTIRVVVSRKLGRVHVVIKDSGLGIPPDRVDHVFDPFVTSKSAGAGTGLGLWICHNLMRSFGGEITLTSELGQGTEVRLTLLEAAPPVAATPPKAPSVRGSYGKVLVIDDEPAILEVLEAGLSALTDASVTTASSGAAALEALSARTFDAVICDLTMPDIGGAEIHAALVRQGRGERMILLTGGAFTDSGRAFLARFDGPVLGKPFRIRDVAQALSELQAS